MQPVIFAVLFMQLIGGLVLLVVIPKQSRQVREGAYVKNSDFLKREILYRIHMDERQLVDSLRLKNIYDGIEYELDETNRRITFSYEGYRIFYPYTYSVEPWGSAYLLCLRNPNMNFFHASDRMLIDINSFFIRKCGAEALDYDKAKQK